jgi:AmmeMemoRadiSam system protein B
MKHYLKAAGLAFLLFMLLGLGSPAYRIRKPVDPVGFATKAWQMDSVMKRIQRLDGRKIAEAWTSAMVRPFTTWKLAVCPHDDYTYAGWLYPAVLANVRTNTVILIGVAHKAKKFRLENRMVFDSFDFWQSPYGPVRVSGLREKIMNKLPRSTYVVHDSLQQSEHSLEAIIPFLQFYNRQVEIVPILIPFMSFETMNSLSMNLAIALGKLVSEGDINLGRDYSIVVSNDAVHYGCDDWGGADYAFYGCDSNGFRLAVNHEHEIIRGCLEGEINGNKIQNFVKYTVQDTNFRSYRWTWCGRYSVPFGLLTLSKLESALRLTPSQGILLGYSTSITQKPLPVTDLGMGSTAGASIRHWVGYAAMGYR